jgi:hypothetical protein
MPGAAETDSQLVGQLGQPISGAIARASVRLGRYREPLLIHTRR